MRKYKSLVLVGLATAIGILAAGCASEEAAAPVTEKPANFKGMEGSSQGAGGGPAGGQAEGRANTAPPPGF